MASAHFAGASDNSKLDSGPPKKEETYDESDKPDPTALVSRSNANSGPPFSVANSPELICPARAAAMTAANACSCSSVQSPVVAALGKCSGACERILSTA